MTQALASKNPDSAGSTPSTPRPWPSSYFEQTLLPLTCLLFVLPLIVLYELGTWLWATPLGSQSEQRIIAFVHLQYALRARGEIGRFLPGMMVATVLLAIHIVRRDAWRVSRWTLLAMALESMALAIPLGVIGIYFSRQFPMIASHHLNLQAMLVLSVGAGVYEEFVFRFALVAFLDTLFTNILRLKGFWSGLLMVVISAMAFSAYHYLGSERPTLQSFAFRTVAGIYFSMLYMFRGFGVTAGTHAAYDILVTAVRAAG